MNTNQILSAILPICCGLLTSFGCWGIKSIAGSLAVKAKNELASRCITEIATAVTNAVRATNQAYVDDLKASNTFDKAAQKNAFDKALRACMQALSDDAVDFIEENSGNVTEYLTNLIESQVRDQKVYL